MAEETKHSIPPFHQRFNIQVDIDDAQERFIKRAINLIHGAIPELGSPRHKSEVYKRALIEVASKLGVKYEWNDTFGNFAGNDFYSCLLSLETLYQTYDSIIGAPGYAREVNESIQHAISLSETDIGIEWRDGAFWPSGAKLLDGALINENLSWLTDRGHHSVLVPFEKGLRHFLEARQKPERLGDTVTDIYEAVEALAKVITDRDKDLSSNAELFISKLGLGDYFRKMLKDYINYANDCRHAAKKGKAKKPLKRNEVEAFIYTSGLFIRLAIQQMAEKSP